MPLNNGLHPTVRSAVLRSSPCPRLSPKSLG